MTEERVPYTEIRDYFLRCYYLYCRNKIFNINHRGGGWIENEFELGYAYEQYESAYDLPIENLMLEVFTLIMIAGRGPIQADAFHRKNIKSILSQYCFEEIIDDITEEEKKDLLYDMTLLDLIDK